MALTLAGKPLFLPDRDDPELAAALRAMDLSQVHPFPRRAFPGKSLTGITWPTGFTPQQPIRVNSLRWGWGASNYALGWFLASGDRVDDIRDSAFGDGGTEQHSLQLVMSPPGLKSQDDSLTATVYLALPPIPIRRVPDGQGGFGAGLGDGSSGLYLLCVTDARRWWWDVPCPDFAIDETSTSWSSIITMCASSLGVTISVDSISTAYRLPSKALNLKDQPIPPILDAICANIGMRLIFNYDGTAKIIGPATAQARRQTDDGNFKGRTLAGGGDWFLDQI